MSGVSNKQVGETEQGMRLDRWFKTHYPQFTHGQVEKCLRKGQIRIDGRRAKASERLEAGQTVRVPPPPEGKPAPDGGNPPRLSLSRRDTDFIRALVIYRDDHFIAIDKPAGLPVQGGSGQERHVDGLLEGLRFESDERPRLVHRLDKDTSGVLLLARSRQAAAAFSKLLKQHGVTKLYWALANGVPKPRDGRIDAPLLKAQAAGRERMAVSDADEAQRAVSDYSVVANAGTKLSFVLLSPVTGRTHQLRIHMSTIGHPIVGDGKYGGKAAHPGGEVSRKLHLHARQLGFTHPFSNQKIRIEAPPPDHMRESWQLFGFDPDYADNPFDPDDCAGACRVR